MYNKDELLDKYRCSDIQITREEAVKILSALKENIKEQCAIAVCIAQEHDIDWNVRFEHIEGMRWGHNQRYDQTQWNSSSSYC